MQHYSLQGCIHVRPLAQASADFDFQNNKNGLNDPKGNKI